MRTLYHYATKENAICFIETTNTKPHVVQFFRYIFQNLKTSSFSYTLDVYALDYGCLVKCESMARGKAILFG